ncbi:hypothetical protein BN1182_BD_00350 [Pantoea ananatis]|nr:hypothetical protein BN1182_BD_00350 [Pantoea ananatis]
MFFSILNNITAQAQRITFPSRRKPACKILVNLKKNDGFNSHYC